MDIEYMELEQLKEQEKYLRKELSTISEKINSYNYRELEKTYGDRFNCSHCRFNIALGFSPEGFHNLCGNWQAPCTCCHRNCTFYKPDTIYTKWIKEKIEDFHLSFDEVRAIKDLFDVSIYEDDIPKEKWELIKKIIIIITN